MRLLKLAAKGGAAIVLAAFSQLHTSPAAAHPHVWITAEAEVLFNDAKAVIGFRQKWTFDDMYTAFAIQGLDKNNDGKYDRAELKELTDVNVTSLKEFQYFTFPKINGRVTDRLEPTDYWLDHDGNKLSLHFTLPLAAPVPYDKITGFTFAIYDPTFYIDFAYAQNAPIRLHAAPSGCTPVINAPPPPQTSVQTLGEAFFSSLDPASDMAAQYAKTVSLACPAN